jgi:hypothetical protein
MVPGAAPKKYNKNLILNHNLLIKNTHTPICTPSPEFASGSSAKTGFAAQPRALV